MTTTPTPSRPPERAFGSAVVVGSGAVGRMLGAILERDGGAVAYFDRTPSAGVAPGDACAPSAALSNAIAAADLVLLALPERALATALPILAGAARRDALIVETASVKTALEPIKAGALGAREILGINPMFAPSLGPGGRAIAVLRQRPGAASDAFCALLAQSGATLVALDADRHDRMTAALQATSHAAILAFADALAHCGEPLEELLRIAPPPFRVLAALAARVLGQSRETYWDIQAANPHAAAARGRLADGLARLETTAGDDGLPAFAAWLDAIERRAGAQTLPSLREDCARMFGTLTDRTPPQGL